MISFIAKKSEKLSKGILSNYDDLSYSNVMKLLRSKDIKVNGVRINKDILLNVGDKIDVYFTPQKKEKFKVVFEDENVLVIDKKSGYTSESVFEELCGKFTEIYFIHRLDRNTAGLMIFAKNKIAESELVSGFKNRNFDKKYFAKVYGVMDKKEGVLTAYLLKDKDKAEVKIFDNPVKGSVEIKTGYKVLSFNGNTSDLSVTLYTGKTHQIRAHLAHIGHFIIGDGKYGDNRVNKVFNAKTQMLYARELTLRFTENQSLYYLNGKTFKTE